MDAIIMCAGLGTRLRPLTDTTPKPLIPVGEKGTLEHTLAILPPSVDRIILVVNYLADQIKRCIGTEYLSRQVVYVKQDPLNGTGGCLRQTKEQVPSLSEQFLVINGDDLYCESDLSRLAEANCGLLAFETAAPRTIDSCDIGEDGYLRGFTVTEKGKMGRINIGAYCLDHRWFETKPVPVPGKEDEWSLPHALAELVNMGVGVQAIDATFWLPVGTPEELEYARKEMTRG